MVDFTDTLHKYLLKGVLERCSNGYDYVYILMHYIVLLYNYSDEMHGMSLYDVVLSYLHNVGLNDYMMKVLLGMN